MNVCVRKETRREILHDLARANKKDFGRRIGADEYIATAIKKITDADIKKLQQDSMTYQDRLKNDYKAYVAQHGQMAFNVYHAKRLSGEIPPPGKEASSGQNE